MIGPKASAKDGSAAVGGDNTGSITNIIALLACENGLANAATQTRQLPPEVADKLRHNQLPVRHPIIRDWTRHSLALERAYHGVEQQNADARYLVRQRAGAVYEEELLKAADGCKIHETGLSDFARQNAVLLVGAVTDRLFGDYCASKSGLVEAEIARLAVSLVVADAVVECEVLEKPDHATAS
jgi:hypothetical protein